ncbi:MAG: hypothetical protein WHV28_05190 [Bacteroidota bacterium]
MKYLTIFLFIVIIGGYLIYRKITRVISKINSYNGENTRTSQDSNRNKVKINNEVIYKNGKVEVLVGEAKRKK